MPHILLERELGVLSRPRPQAVCLQPFGAFVEGHRGWRPINHAACSKCEPVLQLRVGRDNAQQAAAGLMGKFISNSQPISQAGDTHPFACDNILWTEPGKDDEKDAFREHADVGACDCQQLDRRCTVLSQRTVGGWRLAWKRKESCDQVLSSSLQQPWYHSRVCDRREQEAIGRGESRTRYQSVETYLFMSARCAAKCVPRFATSCNVCDSV